MVLATSAHGLRVDSYYPGDVLMWRHLTTAGPALVLGEPPRGVVLPHHSIEGLRVGGFYRALADVVQPPTIYLLSPNHFEAGTQAVVTGEDLEFETVFGTLNVDVDRVEEFVSSGLAQRVDAAFTKEHGVFFHAPYIKRFFPTAKIVPLLIRWGTGPTDLDPIVTKILRQCGPRDLILGSVDFSHYNWRSTAEFHDRSSFASIVNFDGEALFDREIDSPGSIYVLEQVMTGLGFRRAERVWQTNTDDLAFEPQDNATSHQYFTFTRGQPDLRQSFTVLLIGRSRLKQIRTSWPWDRSYQAANDPGPSKFLSELRGTEDRFFMGSDLYLLDPPPSENPRKFGRNGVNVVVFSFDSTGSLPTQIALVQAQKPSRSIVLYRFDGRTAPMVERRRLGRAFVEAGAEIFVVQDQPGDELDVEPWKQGVLALALGDFLPDPSASSQGLVVQAELTAPGLWYQTLALKVRDGYPRLVPDR